MHESPSFQTNKRHSSRTVLRRVLLDFCGTIAEVGAARGTRTPNPRAVTTSARFPRFRPRRCHTRSFFLLQVKWFSSHSRVLYGIRWRQRAGNRASNRCLRFICAPVEVNVITGGAAHRFIERRRHFWAAIYGAQRRRYACQIVKTRPE